MNRKYIDFSLDINFLKPKVKFDLQTLDLSKIPDEESLIQVLAQNYKVRTDEIELFSGENSAVFSIFRHLNLSHCTIYSPANEEYKKACVSFGYEIRTINSFENLFLPIKEGSLVVFENPSSLTGKYEDLEMLLEFWKQKACTVFIDETSLDFCSQNSATKYLSSYDNLYILKSMSKFYSLQAFRVATIISKSKNIQKLKRFEPRYKISQFDITFLQKVLKEDIGFKTISKAVILKNKLELIKILEASKIVEKIYKSSTNVLLVKLKNIKAYELQGLLEEESIKIRNCEQIDFLDSSFIRVCVKSSSENLALKKALDKVC